MVDARAIELEAAKQLLEGRWPEYEWVIAVDGVRCDSGAVTLPLRDGEPWLAGFVGKDGHTYSGIGPGPRAAFSRARIRAELLQEDGRCRL